MSESPREHVHESLDYVRVTYGGNWTDFRYWADGLLCTYWADGPDGIVRCTRGPGHEHGEAS